MVRELDRKVETQVTNRDPIAVGSMLKKGELVSSSPAMLGRDHVKGEELDHEARSSREQGSSQELP